ncbi:MAG TPA: protein kinase [candidate division Zixibacteria bacterium]|nr:protein kinase [candidate division Zixibacteria bacterium]
MTGDLINGATVSHYRIVEKIGAGGMGEVYLAEDTRLKRRVALKFLPTQLAEDPEVRTRFLREAQAAAGLDHPNIVTVHEVGEHRTRPYFAMQYVNGRTLHHYAYKEPLAVTEVLSIVAQIADGLAKAHGIGVVHRDIKSVNIILDEERRPKILDFGLVAVSGGQTLTKVGSTLGTISYMSPEQAQGLKVDHRSDIFSLGVVLYELLTGQSPFQQEHDAATLYTILNVEPAPLTEHKPELSDALQGIVSRCLAKDIKARYQSAADLAQDLRAERTTKISGASQPTIPAADAQPSLAVLPLANMSADPENEFFADGLTEELLNVLAKNPELKVTGRTSSFAFKGKQEDLREIGRKLGVRTLLEGSVRKAGNRVRITAQLVSASDGFHLWSETYDRVLEDIFAVQDEIAQSVANALHVTLVGGQSGRQPQNAQSYALTLQAKTHTRRMTIEDAKEAERLYRQALDIDPNNAQAWAGLATSYLFYGAFGGTRSTQESYRTSKKYVLKALELDDQLTDAYYALGWIRAAFEYHFDEAKTTIEKAVALAPNNSVMVGALGLLTGLLGEFDRSIALLKRAVELDPLNHEAHMNLGRILLWSGQTSEARSASLKAIELSPGTPGIRASISYTYLYENRLAEALEAALKEGSDGYRNCALAMVYHAMNNREESDKALATFKNESDHWGYQIAIIHGFRGEVDEAFAWLDKAIAANDAGIPTSKITPFLKCLHDDPRWLPLLKRIGLQ